jgi:SAM-dependent methyltransferase
MTCIACGARAAQRLYAVNGFDVVRCACGLARTDVPTDFDPAAIYTEDYFQGGQHDGYADYAGSRDALRAEFRRTLDVLPVHGGKLIEIGCAYGFFLDEAAARFEVCGVEVSDAARRACAERGHAVARDLDDGVLARGPFDAAVMLDVIEHLPDPGVVLAKLATAMRPGAPLVITTGDFGSALARVMGKRWRLMTPPQHLWFFSRHTLGALLARHGFRVARVEHPWKQVPLELIAYQATRYVGGQRLVKRFPPPGRIPLNLFDAMRVMAIRT